MLAGLLFGLEETILTQCSAKEIKRYERLAYFFLLLILLGCVSFYYFFYLLTQNYVSAFFGTLVLSFIYYSIIRFTIITINVSLHEEMTMRRMLRNYANTYRVLIFAAFIVTILVPLIALFNHNNYTYILNKHKNSLNTQYQLNRTKAKKQQLTILASEIANLNKQKNVLIEKVAKSTNSMDKALSEFEIRKVETQIFTANKKLAFKDSTITEINNKIVEQYQVQLLHSEMPFFRFKLVFKNQLSITYLIILFCVFILIIPFYVRVLVSKNSIYAKLYKDEIKNRIINEYELTKNDCSRFLHKQFSYTKINNALYLDSPFNNKPIHLPYKKSTNKNLFDYLQKKEGIITKNE